MEGLKIIMVSEFYEAISVCEQN